MTTLRREPGFTLIELLIVLLIIGILAAIALPAFIGQRDKAKDSNAKANARNLVSQVESCFTESDLYNPCTVAGKVGEGLPFVAGLPAATSGNVGVVAAGEEYTVVSASKSGNDFSIVKDSTGIPTRSCSTTGSTRGGCNGGTW